MATYQAPLRDMRFVLHELLNVERRFAELPGAEELSAELVDAVLEEVAKLCEAVLLPLNRVGDEEGCRFENGVVRTPSGFKEAYRAFREGGWTSLSCDPAHGGQGLPKTINFFVDEMVASSNMAFGLYVLLTYGAYRVLSEYASEADQALYLPRLASGEWTGTMCLTEPHCGTDLALTRTRAALEPDGSYRVTGTKIFITGGEQDLSENIVHLVLARGPDAPPGVKGLSMFLVPKFLAKKDGSLGARNGVSCGSIESKMGIHGAPTCVLNFDAATGYLVGELHGGMHHMFTMMNHARLVVGLQGLAQAEVAYQSAAGYAKERLQGRSPAGPRLPERAADPIIVHPDVRRMLLTARAYNEAARALGAWVGVQLDCSLSHPDADLRQRAGDLVALLTPVVKGFFTDYACEACNLCLQVLGGHGYIKEWGMEQLVRDARIAPIYEGTNGGQALDLVGRKLFMHDGRLIEQYLGIISEFAETRRARADLREFVDPLEDGVRRLRRTTRWICEQGSREAQELGAASSDYLRFLGLVSFAFMWAMMADVAAGRAHGPEADFYRAKLQTGRFFMQRLLPQINTLEAVISAGGGSLMELPAEGF